jgi:hypothetical protein
MRATAPAAWPATLLQTMHDPLSGKEGEADPIAGKKGYPLERLMIDRFIEADYTWYDSIRQMLETDRKIQRDTHVSAEPQRLTFLCSLRTGHLEWPADRIRCYRAQQPKPSRGRSRPSPKPCPCISPGNRGKGPDQRHGSAAKDARAPASQPLLSRLPFRNERCAGTGSEVPQRCARPTLTGQQTRGQSGGAPAKDPFYGRHPVP